MSARQCLYKSISDVNSFTWNESSSLLYQRIFEWPTMDRCMHANH